MCVAGQDNGSFRRKDFPSGTLSTREEGSSGVGDLVFSDTHHETGLFLSLQDVDKPTELWYSIAELRKPHA